MPPDTPDIQLHNISEHTVPVNLRLIEKCVSEVARQEACSFQFLEVVYVDEDKIVEINREHLGRDYITDVITFRYDEQINNISIEGTIFCCAPRIYEQSKEFNQTARDEFLRILIHGLLHLAGYDDTTEREKDEMRSRENFYLEFLA